MSSMWTRAQSTNPENDEPRYLEDLEPLEAALQDAVSESVLLEEPRNQEELQQFVIEERLRV